MRWTTDVLANRPGVVAQPERHGRRAPVQGAVDSYPVVKVAPQPQGPAQPPLVTRGAPTPPPQASPLATQRPVKPLQVRGVDRRADAQLDDSLADRPQSA